MSKLIFPIYIKKITDTLKDEYRIGICNQFIHTNPNDYEYYSIPLNQWLSCVEENFKFDKNYKESPYLKRIGVKYKFESFKQLFDKYMSVLEYFGFKFMFDEDGNLVMNPKEYKKLFPKTERIHRVMYAHHCVLRAMFTKVLRIEEGTLNPNNFNFDYEIILCYLFETTKFPRKIDYFHCVNFIRYIINCTTEGVDRTICSFNCMTRGGADQYILPRYKTEDFFTEISKITFEKMFDSTDFKVDIDIFKQDRSVKSPDSIRMVIGSTIYTKGNYGTWNTPVDHLTITNLIKFYKQIIKKMPQ